MPGLIIQDDTAYFFFNEILTGVGIKVRKTHTMGLQAFTPTLKNQKKKKKGDNTWDNEAFVRS